VLAGDCLIVLQNVTECFNYLLPVLIDHQFHVIALLNNRNFVVRVELRSELNEARHLTRVTQAKLSELNAVRSLRLALSLTIVLQCSTQGSLIAMCVQVNYTVFNILFFDYCQPSSHLNTLTVVINKFIFVMIIYGVSFVLH